MRNVITDSTNLLFPFGSNPQRFSHMLRLADRKPINDIVSYLLEGCNMVCIGGGTVEGWINDGRRNYGDIDLIARPISDETLGFMLQKIRRGCPDHNYPNSFAEEDLRNSQKSHLFSVASYVPLGGRDFKPVEFMDKQLESPEILYLNGPIEYRFNLLPKRSLFERVLGRPSVIDLSFINPRLNF